MLPLIRLQNYIAKYIGDIDTIISSIVAPAHIHHIAHSVSFGGKRVRPIILILLSNLLGASYRDKFISAAASIELIHIASLLHDDIIDQNTKRHNAETAHILFGNQKTILAGDFLFAESFKQMVKVKNFDVLEVISKASSVLATGELEQLQIKNDLNIQIQDYFEIIYKKTASLFEATAEIAALIQESPLIKKIKLFGKEIGMAFQIIDDLIDYTSPKTNKKSGTDFMEQKLTLPMIFALSNLSELDKNEKSKLTTLFLSENKTINSFEMAVELINKGGGFSFSKERAIVYCQTAKNLLHEFATDSQEEKGIIIEVIDFFINRVH